jgi:hypothetical protein
MCAAAHTRATNVTARERGAAQTLELTALRDVAARQTGADARAAGRPADNRACMAGRKATTEAVATLWAITGAIV